MDIFGWGRGSVEKIGQAVEEEIGPLVAEANWGWPRVAGAVVEETGSTVVEEIGAAVVEELGPAVVVLFLLELPTVSHHGWKGCE